MRLEGGCDIEEGGCAMLRWDTQLEEANQQIAELEQTLREYSAFSLSGSNSWIT